MKFSACKVPTKMDELRNKNIPVELQKGSLETFPVFFTLDDFGNIWIL